MVPSASIDVHFFLRGSTWPRGAPAPSAQPAPKVLNTTSSVVNFHRNFSARGHVKKKKDVTLFRSSTHEGEAGIASRSAR